MTQQQIADGQDNTKPAADDVNGQPVDNKAGEQNPAGTPPVDDKPADDAKPDDANPDDGAKPDDDGGEDDKKPEDVEYVFELPEGFEMDEEIGNDLKALAKEKNLTVAEAQKFVDLGVKMKVREAEAFQKMQDTWVEQIKADPTIGGDKLGENIAVAKKAIDTFGTPELKSLLDASRFGNHPEVVKFAYNVGKAMNEDRVVIGQGKPRGMPAEPAKTMFPNQN